MRSAIVSTLMILLPLLMIGAEPYYLTVSAKKGDGVYSLLRQYDLAGEPCNFQHFYKLNNLDKNEGLKINTKYQLPILIVDYNGISIRSTLKMDDWDTAVAIQNYNTNIKDLGKRKTQYTDSNILWVPHHLYGCDGSNDIVIDTPAADEKQSGFSTEPSPKKLNPITNTPSTVSTSSSTVTEKLFGASHQTVPLIDQSLKGKVYYIVSGHGGIDPGTMCTDCVHTLCEDEYAYDVALRLSRSLLQKGATVHIITQDTDGIRDGKYLSCDTDETTLGGAKVAASQKNRLAQRTHKINQLYAKHKAEGVKEQYAMFVHIDANHKEKRMDVYFFHHEKSKTGRKLAENLQSTFRDKYAQHQANRGYNGSVRTRNLYVVKNTHPPAILVELGNIKNTSDQKRIMLSGNRQALADWMAEGLATFKP